MCVCAQRKHFEAENFLSCGSKLILGDKFIYSFFFFSHHHVKYVWYTINDGKVHQLATKNADFQLVEYSDGILLIYIDGVSFFPLSQCQHLSK